MEKYIIKIAMLFFSIYIIPHTLFAAIAKNNPIYCIYIRGLPNSKTEGKYVYFSSTAKANTVGCWHGHDSRPSCLDSADAEHHVGKQTNHYYICDPHYLNCELAATEKYTVTKICSSYYAEPKSNTVDLSSVANKHKSCYKK